MTETDREHVRHRELEFFGEITASVSHELNNAFATIEQTAGLLEDLIAAGECEGLAKDQLQRIADRIGKQTARGATIVKRLNTFAHSTDATEREIEFNELAENVLALANRLIERRRVQLDFRTVDERIVVSGNLFLVQEALFLSVRAVVSVMPEGSRVLVSTEMGDTMARIAVDGELPDSSPEIDLSDIEMLMSRLDGEMRSGVGEGRVFIQLGFPRQQT